MLTRGIRCAGLVALCVLGCVACGEAAATPTADGGRPDAPGEAGSPALTNDASVAPDAALAADAAGAADAADAAEVLGDSAGGDSSTPVSTSASLGTQCLDLDPEAFEVAFAGGLLLVENPQGVSLLRTSDFSVARTFSAHRGSFVGAVLSRDGTGAAAIDDDGKLHLFGAANGQQVAVATPSPQPTLVAFTPDGSDVVVADAAGTVTLVRWADGVTLWQVAILDGGTGAVTDIAASPDGTTIALSSSSAVSLLATTDGSLRAQFTSGGTAIAFAPDGSYLALANASEVTLLSPANGSPIGSPMNSTSIIHDLAVSPDSTLIAAAADNAHVPVFRRTDGTLAQDLKYTAATNPQGQTPIAAFHSVSFSPDGSQVAAAEQRLHVWRLSDGAALVQPDSLEPGMIWEQSIARSSPLVAFARVGGPAQIWDYTAGSSKDILPGVSNGNQGTVAFDPGDDLLVDVERFRAGADGGTLEQGTLWRVGSSAPLRTFTYANSEQPDRDGDLVFSPDGTMLAGPGSSAQPGLLRLWNPADGSLSGSTSAFLATIGPIVWSPDGTLVAAAGADHIDTTQPLSPPTDESIRFFRVPTLQLVATLTGLADTVTGLAFLADGQHVVSSDGTGLVRLWAVNGSSSRDLASSAQGSNAIAVSPKGDLVAVRGVLWDTHGHNGSIGVRRTADGVEVGHFYLYGDGNMGAMGWSPDGDSLLSGSASALHVFCLAQIGPPEAALDASVSPGDSGAQDQ